MFLCPQNSDCIKILTLNVVLGDGVFGRGLEHEGGAIMNRIGFLIQETLEMLLIPFTM